LGIELRRLPILKRLHMEPFFRIRTTIAKPFKIFQKF